MFYQFLEIHKLLKKSSFKKSYVKIKNNLKNCESYKKIAQDRAAHIILGIFLGKNYFEKSMEIC